MSIEGKHAYRFGYLKSEHWKNVRLFALAREGGKCQICSEESISNDVHHIWYPDNIYETTERHLVVLCRPCHDFVHCMLPGCKGLDEDEGILQWQKLKNAILVWRKEKIALFQTGVPYEAPAQLRSAYEKLKEKYESLYRDLNGKCPEELTVEQEYHLLKSLISKWFKEKKILTESCNCANEGNSCENSTPRNDMASL